MRQKVKSKNLKYSIFRIDKEKNIEIFNDAGWHFNNIMSPQEISIKLKTFAHSEFSTDQYSNPKTIEEKINLKIDLFERGHQYIKISLDDSMPKYILQNKENYRKWII